MGIVQKDAFRTMLISYLGIVIGYLNKGVLFLIILTTEQIGLVNLVVSVGTLFAQFANMGTIYSTWKFLPFFKNETKKHHGFLLLMLLIAGSGIIICTLGTWLFQPQIVALYKERSPLFIDYYFWIIPIGIAYVLFMVLEVYLRSFYRNIVAVFALEIVLRLAITVLLFLLYFGWLTFDAFVALQSLVYVLPTMILLVYLYNLGELHISPKHINISKRFRKIIFQFSAFNYINTLGTVLVNSLDIMMIAQMLGLKATGVYSTVIFLASALQVPYKSLVRISSPMIADCWKHREFDKMKALYTKVSSVSLFIGLSIFCIIWMNIDFLFGFLKPEFQPGIWVFFFLMMGRLVDMYGGLNSSIFTTSKKYKYDILFTLFLIVCVFLLNLYFIPNWGIPGAAISTSIALIVYNLGRLIFVYAAFKIHPFNVNQVVMIVLALLTLVVGHAIHLWITNEWLDVVMQTLAFVMVFCLPIYVFNLEPESIGYVQKGLNFINEKVFKRSK
jgi:O-antigen/teichoic acid export membrane protein